MATSPIYGWAEPDNTDLVKNGALAIRTLGNAIDTTMGTMVAKTIIDAKGDLIAGSAADTALRLAVGSNGETLVADSSTSTGLRYQGSITAGKNFLINGGFDIWQRGTSFSISAFNPLYSADRWTTFNGNAVTMSQETTTVPTGANYAMKITGGATTSNYEMFQGIESLNAIRLANKAVVATILATGTTGITHSLTIEYSNSVDPNAATGTWTGVGTAGTASVTSGTFSTIKATATIPSTAKSIRIKVTTGSLTSGQTAIFGNAQLELGSVATEFSRAGGTVQGELAACQRYYYLHASGNTQPIGISSSYSTTLSISWLSLPVTMRIVPTIAATTGTNYYGMDIAGTGPATNALTIGQASTTSVRVDGTYSGLTAGQAGYLRTNNASSSLAFTSEL